MESILTGLITLTLAGISAVWFRRTRDPLCPGGLQAGLWAFVCFAYLTLPHGLNAISLQTCLVVLGGCVAFSLGAALTDRKATSGTPGGAAPSVLQESIWLVRFILVWLPIAIFPVVLMRAIELAESYWVTDSFYINLRIASVNEKNRYGILAYGCTLSFASVFIELVLSKKRLFDVSGWIAFAFSLGYAVVSTGRTFFFLLLIGVTGVIILKRGASYRYGLLSLVTILIVFFMQGQALKNLEMFDRSEGPIVSALRTFGIYMLGGLAGFDHEVPATELWAVSFDNTFRSGFAALRALGADVEVVPLLKEWVYVPEPTNVYSVFQPYAEDFGLIGAIFCLAVLGAMHGALRSAARSGDRRYMIIYALSLYPLMMQFFQDQYASLFTTWAIFGAVAFAAVRPPLKAAKAVPSSTRLGGAVVPSLKLEAVSRRA